jgi:hypothetical protein
MAAGATVRVRARWLGPAVLAAVAACELAPPATPGASLGDLSATSSTPIATLAQTPAATIASAWLPTASMAEARQGHTATQLLDGRVLVIGGFQEAAEIADDRVLASTELFDPQAGTWAPGPPLPSPRGRHQAIRLKDGRVLVLGGVSQRTDPGAGVETVDVFDPSTNAWSEVGSLYAGEQRRPLLLRDGRVVVEGRPQGYYGVPPRQLDVFDPATGKWTTVAKGASLHGFPTAVLPDGSVLMIPAPEWVGTGAAAEGETAPRVRVVASDVAWRYDPVRNSWKELDPAPFAFDVSLAAPLEDGRVLLLGNGAGSREDALLYGGPGYPWDPEGTPPYAAHMRNALTLSDGRVLFVGARDCIGAVLPAWILDWTGMSIEDVWGLPNAYGSSVTVLADGRVLAAGGVTSCPDWRQRGQTDAAYLFDPATIPS